MGDLDIENKPMADQEQNTNGLPNGLANGTSEHKEHKEHKHKSKDKDRDRERSKDKDRHRDKDRHKSSHKDKDRDKERSRDKDRHSSSHKSSHKDKDRDKDRERSKSRDKDKEKDRDRHRDKDREHKEKEKSNRDDKHKDKDRKEKDDKHGERSREKDKDRHKSEKSSSSSSSSSKKDKHHSSSHKSSHKDKHRDKDRSDSGRKDIKEEKIEIKTEPEEFINQEENGDLNDSCNSLKEDTKSEIDLNYLTIKEEVEVKEELMDQTEDSVKEDSEEDSHLVIKEEPNEEEEDDLPLSARKRIKRDPDYNEEDEDEDEDKPLILRKKPKTEKRKRKKRDEDEDFDEEDEDFKPSKKKVKKEKEKKPKIKTEKENKNNSVNESPTKGRKKKVEEEQNVWKWWEEEKRDDGKKWTFLEHKGPVFADPYERLPSHVKFYYDSNHMVLSEPTEEVAGFYAKMLEHDYTTKEVFNKNFFKDWRKVMNEKERAKITDLSKCDFRKLHEYYVQKNEERKNRTKEEKKALKEKNEAVVAEYGWCIIDGHKQRIGNFKIEPPGLFRGRGEHPKQGMLKKRTMPEEVIINCSKDSKIPKPPEGHKWKEVRHDPNVTWLACWNENIQGSTKYVMLNAASKLKGEKDWQKYETARRLHMTVDKIRENYRMDWKSKEMRIRQRGVALYFIDKLALRAGNEKDEDQADTVGCCSLRYEHLTLHPEKDGKEFVVVFDFLGKDSIRYYNEVPVEKRVFKNLQLFMENKQDGDDIFDRLNTQILNKHLNELLEGLTAKVFRTYNASRTLQEQLEKMTNPDDPIPAKILSYNRANREVAILCNHQRAVPKTFDKSMANLQKKIDDKKELIEEAEKELKSLKKAAKHGGTVKEKVAYEKKKKAVDRLKEQLDKLEISATDKEENKQIALGTSKLNYLDPRITVAWCKKFDVPIDKVYNKTQRQKFQWAIDMATAEYNFMKQDKNAKFTGKAEEDEEEEEED